MPLLDAPNPVSVSSTNVTGAAAASLSQPAGALFLSGTPSGGYAGPWAIEQQILTVEYVRVPTKLGFASGSDTELISLSANSVRQMEVRETSLRCVIHSHTSLVKDYNVYSTSAHQQPQKFMVLRDSDQFGKTYLHTSSLSPSAYVLGPAGTVITIQPYIRRVPWDEDIHPLLAQSLSGYPPVITCNYYSEDMDGIPQNWNTYFSDFNYAIDKGLPHTFLGRNEGTIFPDAAIAGTGYRLNGAYSTAKETDAKFISFMNNIGTAIAGQALYRATWTEGVHYTIDPTTGGAEIIPTISLTVGNPFYSIGRHQY